MLGDGGFGFVIKGINKKSGLERAIKFIEKTEKLEIEKLIQEVEILK